MTQTQRPQSEPEIIPPDAAFRRGQWANRGPGSNPSPQGFRRAYILRPGPGTLILGAILFSAATVTTLLFVLGLFVVLLPVVGIFAALLVVLGVFQRSRYLRRM